MRKGAQGGMIYIGKPCPHGHKTGERYLSNHRCVACTYPSAKAWHPEHPEVHLKAARRRIGDTKIPASFQNHAISFVDWAEDYVNQLDPLHHSQRRKELTAKPSDYYGSDSERRKEGVSRSLGNDWKSAWKINADYSPKPQPELKPPDDKDKAPDSLLMRHSRS
jgi:hypothetical protein